MALERREKSIGVIIITRGEDKNLYSLELEGHPDDLIGKKKVVFSVSVSEDESLNRK